MVGGDDQPAQGNLLSGDVREVLSAAERLAEAIREEAEQYAHARLQEAEAEAARRLRTARHRADALLGERRARVGELGSAVVGHVESLLGHLEAAEAARADLGAALSELVTADRTPSTVDPGTSATAARQVAISEPDNGAEKGANGAPDPLSGPRLLALQMALDGLSRAEAARGLRETLGVHRPDAVVDDVFAAYEARR